MIAVDTNVLVHAHRSETSMHSESLDWLRALSEGSTGWAIPVFCLGEFIRVVTHRRIFDPPTKLDVAISAIKSLNVSPTLRALRPGERYSAAFLESCRAANARGNLSFDAQIAALCWEHGCKKLLTLDHDFSRFPNIEIIDPADAPGKYLS